MALNRIRCSETERGDQRWGSIKWNFSTGCSRSARQMEFLRFYAVFTSITEFTQTPLLYKVKHVPRHDFPITPFTSGSCAKVSLEV
jgi:hypothetical protein